MGQQRPSWPNSAQPVVVEVARTIPAAFRALWCTYPSSHTPTACVRKTRRSVVKRSPKKQSVVFGIRAAPLMRSQAAMRPAHAAEWRRRNQDWCGQQGTISTTRASSRSMMSKIASSSWKLGSTNDTELRQSWVKAFTPSTESNRALKRTHVVFDGLA